MIRRTFPHNPRTRVKKPPTPNSGTNLGRKLVKQNEVVDIGKDGEFYMLANAGLEQHFVHACTH